MSEPLPPQPYNGAGVAPQDPPQDDVPQQPGSVVDDEGEDVDGV